jgi:hypothetical protein
MFSSSDAPGNRAVSIIGFDNERVYRIRVPFGRLPDGPPEFSSSYLIRLRTYPTTDLARRLAYAVLDAQFIEADDHRELPVTIQHSTHFAALDTLHRRFVILDLVATGGSPSTPVKLGHVQVSVTRLRYNRADRLVICEPLVSSAVTGDGQQTLRAP